MSEEHWKIVHNNRNVVSNSPEQLWDNAVSYFQWCDDNPIRSKVTLTSGKEAGKVVMKQQTRPYSIKALCLHCNLLEEYLRDIRNSRSGDDYYVVVSKILYIVYTQNLENAMVDNFNPIFTAKVLNMEKEDTGTAQITINHVTNSNVEGGKSIPELSFSENQILEKLELENDYFKKSKEQNS